MKPSADYETALKATRDYHAGHKTYSGRFATRYRQDIKEIVDRLGCRTMLDYGCGKGAQYAPDAVDGMPFDRWLGIEVTKYDPGVPEFAAEPAGKFDLVIATQVFGAIPFSDYPYVLGRLVGYATKAVYIGERLGVEVHKKLHLSMQEKMPYGWTHEQWLAALARTDDSPVEVWLRTKDKRRGRGDQAFLVQIPPAGVDPSLQTR